MRVSAWRKVICVPAGPVKFTVTNNGTVPTDGTTVTVRLLRDPRDPKYALITVRDHGPGVPESELARIFEPFYRTDSARTRSSGGTGLGLAIARRAVEWHGGRICASNAEGGGLEVSMRLPKSPGVGAQDRV